MALLNINDNKFITKPNNPNEQVKAEYIVILPTSANKKQVILEGQYCVPGKSQPIGPPEKNKKGEDIPFVPKDIWVPKGTFHIGTFEMDWESPTYPRDCHEKAIEVLGSGFEIVDLKN